MSFVNKISNILKHDRNNFSYSENVQKILLLNFTLITVSALSLFFSINHFLFFDRTVSYILFSYFIIFLVTFLYFRKNKNYQLFSNITIVLSTSLFLILIIIGAGEKTGVIWGLTYPVIVTLTFQIKKANIFSLVFLGLTLLIFFIPSSLWAEYPIGLKLRFIGAYLGIFGFLQYYLRLKQQAINNREKFIIETQQKLREKEEFLSKLSYQIRTPLNNVAGIVNLKRETLGKETAEEVELSISNLITIVNSIPDSFDKKLLQIKGEKNLFNFNSTIKKSLDLFETDKYSNLKSSLHLSGKIPQFVFGDRLILIQIIISAIDFLYNNKDSEGLKLDVISSLGDDSETVILKIKSHSDYKILQSNLNVETEIDFNKIGNKELLVIKELTSLLSGQINISNNKASTSFLFSFKFTEKNLDKQEITDDLNSKDNDENFFYSQSKKALKDCTILLVEDDIMNSKVMTLNLQKHVNKIIIAENGKEALEKYASTRVDLILMDIRMPLMDGFKTTEKIREAEIGIGFKIPIIAVTANASSEIKNKCFEVGMDDYTTKPTNFEILLKKMNAQLS